MARPELRRLAKRALLAADSLMTPVDGIVVLAYHRVGARTPSPVDLATGDFRRQLEHLVDTSDVIALDAAVDRLTSTWSGGNNPTIDCSPRRAVVLTFDDGTADFAEVVVPLLVELDVPATLYLATSYIDSGREFPASGAPLSWAAVRECATTGLVTIGSHTHTHALLDRCDPLTVDLELDVSGDRIADELGHLPEHFAYPKAVGGSRHADGAVRRRYRSAAVAGTRANPYSGTDPWVLRRSPVQVADGWDGFVRKLAGGMRTEDDLRRMVNSVRHRGRTS